MNVGIIPNAHGGRTAVYLEDGDYENLHVHLTQFSDLVSDVELLGDLEVQVVGELRHGLLSYCWALRSWFGQWGVALAWALVSLVVLSTQKLWTYGLKTAVLYGWIYVLFFGDGVMALTRLLCHAGPLRRARAIRKGLAEETEVWYHTHPSQCVPRPRNANESERSFAARNSSSDFWYAPYYSEMLAERPRLLHGFWPSRLTLLLQSLFVGPWIPRPRFAMELGEVT